MKEIGRRLRPSPALVVACLALFIAMGGAGYAAVKLSKGNVKTKNIKNGAVKTNKIADQAVTSDKVFLGVVSNQNVGLVAGGACTTLSIPTPGIQATDHVLATPPPGYTDTFGLVADPNPGGAAVTLQLCNLFQGGGAADPDGGGGPYKVLVIR